jgi:GMP synthase-like glutamine amidotransferase
MRVLTIQNFEATGLGQMATPLDEAQAAVDIVKAYEGEPIPADTGRYDGLVVLGGEQNALDDIGSPYFPTLLEEMRAFGRSGRAVLGICLGAQLLARAHAAENRIGAAPEFGWCEVALTGEGRADPLTSGLPARFPIFEWHDDTFTLPEGAVRLAANGTAPNQAFRIGRAAYGVQFHFEADRKLVREWNSIFADVIAARHPGWETIHRTEAERHGEAADAAGLAIARAWVRCL